MVGAIPADDPWACAAFINEGTRVVANKVERNFLLSDMLLFFSPAKNSEKNDYGLNARRTPGI